MLRELHISNLAVIADVRMELASGLNCFTGATGAGKSLVIGAVEVLLGLRSPAEMLRPGADEGRVSGVFEIRNAELLGQIQRLTDVPVTDDGGELLLTRRLYASGRSSVSLNGNPITLTMLRNVAEHLVDVHGQHDHQYLLKPANQIDVLDQFGGLWQLRSQYCDMHDQVLAAKKRLDELSTNRLLREQQLELYRFQADEIDAAAMEPAEVMELRSRADVLQNLEKLKKDAGAAYSGIYESDGAVLERLRGIATILAELASIDSNLKPVAKGLADSAIQLEESAFDLSRYLDKLDLDPGELVEVNDRLNTINRLLNKYGDPVEATLSYRTEIGEKIALLERATDDFSKIHKELDPLIGEMRTLGAELSTQRRKVAKRLGPLIQRELVQLGMEQAKFTVSITSSNANDHSFAGLASGLDVVEFTVQTNPGQLPHPLRKIASGGELSRVMLAMKGILAQSDRISVLVFDEIDANVGGRLGSTIGKKLRLLAEHHQVICITHLPQIASYADRHLTVSKEVVGKTTQTKVRAIGGSERVEELAAMIGGQRITETTRAQARELMDAAQSEVLSTHTTAPTAAKSSTAPSRPSARARRKIRAM